MAKGDRKRYAYVRKDQKGTPMESFITSKKQGLEEYNNKGPKTNRLKNTQVKGKEPGVKSLRRSWDTRQRKGTGASALHKYMKDHKGVGRPAARSKLKDLHVVSFAADPHNK